MNAYETVHVHASHHLTALMLFHAGGEGHAPAYCVNHAIISGGLGALGYLTAAFLAQLGEAQTCVESMSTITITSKFVLILPYTGYLGKESRRVFTSLQHRL